MSEPDGARTPPAAGEPADDQAAAPQPPAPGDALWGASAIPDVPEVPYAAAEPPAPPAAEPDWTADPLPAPEPPAGEPAWEATTTPYVPEPPAAPYVPEPPAAPYVPEPPAAPYVPEPPAAPYVPEPPAAPYVPEPPVAPYVPEAPAPEPPGVPYVPEPPAAPAPDDAGPSATEAFAVSAAATHAATEAGVPEPRPAAEPKRAKKAAKKDAKKDEGSFLKELPVLLLIALVLAMVIKAFLVQAFFIPSGSMEQTLHGCPGCKGDRVLVNKVVYKLRDINRGEIVVFNGLDSFTSEVRIAPPKNGFEAARRTVSGWLGLGTPGEKDFIKRVIGLPGDTVACCGPNGKVTVNGVELDEPYVYQDDHRQFPAVTVPPGKLFVMGDHRRFSSDSRVHGPVPEDKVIGRAFVVIWPPSRFKGLPVPSEIENANIPEPGAAPASLPAPPWSVAATPPVLGLAFAVPLTALRRRVRRRRRAA